MCGYIRRVTDSPAVRDLLTQIGLNHLAGQFSGSGQSEVEHFYPAFGGDPHRQIRQLIIPGLDGAKTVDAT